MYTSQIQELEQATKDMLQIIAKTSDAQRNFQPSPTSWSLLGVVEHLTIVESGILGFFKKYNPSDSKRKATFKVKFNNILTKLFFNLPIKIKAPLDSLHPKGEQGLTNLKDVWSVYRQELVQIVQTMPSDKANYTVFKHPIIGPMTMAQTLYFMTSHIRHHIKQMKRIQANADYPK